MVQLRRPAPAGDAQPPRARASSARCTSARGCSDGGGRARVDVSVRVRNRDRARRAAADRHADARRRDAPAALRRPCASAAGARARARASVVVDDPALWSPATPGPLRAARRRARARRRCTPDGRPARARRGTATACYVNGDPLQLRGAALPADARGHGDALTARRRGRARRRAARDRRERHALADAARAEHARRASTRPGIFVWQEIGPWEPAGPLARDDAGEDRGGAATARCARPRRARRTPSILAWTLTNEAPGQGHPGQQEYVAQTARRLHARRPRPPGRRRPLGLGAAALRRAAVLRARRDRRDGLHRLVRGPALGARSARLASERIARSASTPSATSRPSAG